MDLTSLLFSSVIAQGILENPKALLVLFRNEGLGMMNLETKELKITMTKAVLDQEIKGQVKDIVGEPRQTLNSSLIITREDENEEENDSLFSRYSLMKVSLPGKARKFRLGKQDEDETLDCNEDAEAVREIVMIEDLKDDMKDRLQLDPAPEDPNNEFFSISDFQSTFVPQMKIMALFSNYQKFPMFFATDGHDGVDRAFFFNKIEVPYSDTIWTGASFITADLFPRFKREGKPEDEDEILEAENLDDLPTKKHPIFMALLDTNYNFCMQLFFPGHKNPDGFRFDQVKRKFIVSPEEEANGQINILESYFPKENKGKNVETFEGLLKASKVPERILSLALKVERDYKGEEVQQGKSLGFPENLVMEKVEDVLQRFNVLKAAVEERKKFERALSLNKDSLNQIIFNDFPRMSQLLMSLMVLVAPGNHGDQPSGLTRARREIEHDAMKKLENVEEKVSLLVDYYHRMITAFKRQRISNTRSSASPNAEAEGSSRFAPMDVGHLNTLLGSFTKSIGELFDEMNKKKKNQRKRASDSRGNGSGRKTFKIDLEELLDDDEGAGALTKQQEKTKKERTLRESTFDRMKALAKKNKEIIFPRVPLTFKDELMFMGQKPGTSMAAFQAKEEKDIKKEIGGACVGGIDKRGGISLGGLDDLQMKPSTKEAGGVGLNVPVRKGGGSDFSFESKNEGKNLMNQAQIIYPVAQSKPSEQGMDLGIFGKKEKQVSRIFALNSEQKSGSLIEGFGSLGSNPGHMNSGILVQPKTESKQTNLFGGISDSKNKAETNQKLSFEGLNNSKRSPDSPEINKIQKVLSESGSEEASSENPGNEGSFGQPSLGLSASKAANNLGVIPRSSSLAKLPIEAGLNLPKKQNEPEETKQQGPKTVRPPQPIFGLSTSPEAGNGSVLSSSPKADPRFVVFGSSMSFGNNENQKCSMAQAQPETSSFGDGPFGKGFPTLSNHSSGSLLGSLNKKSDEKNSSLIGSQPNSFGEPPKPFSLGNDSFNKGGTLGLGSENNKRGKNPQEEDEEEEKTNLPPLLYGGLNSFQKPKEESKKEEPEEPKTPPQLQKGENQIKKPESGLFKSLGSAQGPQADTNPKPPQPNTWNQSANPFNSQRVADSSAPKPERKDSFIPPNSSFGAQMNQQVPGGQSQPLSLGQSCLNSGGIGMGFPQALQKPNQGEAVNPLAVRGTQQNLSQPMGFGAQAFNTEGILGQKFAIGSGLGSAMSGNNGSGFNFGSNAGNMGQQPKNNMLGNSSAPNGSQMGLFGLNEGSMGQQSLNIPSGLQGMKTQPQNFALQMGSMGAASGQPSFGSASGFGTTSGFGSSNTMVGSMKIEEGSVLARSVNPSSSGGMFGSGPSGPGFMNSGGVASSSVNMLFDKAPVMSNKLRK